MFYCPLVSVATPLQQTRVLVIAKTPPAPPVEWPWPSAHCNGRDVDCSPIRLPAIDRAKLREIDRAHEYMPDPVQPYQPLPSDRNLVTSLCGPWQSPTHDLLLRGWCTPQGVRTGRWEVCTLDDRVVAVVRYWAGVAIGHLDLLDAGGFTVERAFLYDGVFVARGPLLNPIVEPTPGGPGPLGIPRRRTAADGSRWEGLERDDRRVGPWLGYHANGELAAVQYFHLDSGAAIGPWEYYDEHGHRTEVRCVLE